MTILKHLATALLCILLAVIWSIVLLAAGKIAGGVG